MPLFYTSFATPLGTLQLAANHETLLWLMLPGQELPQAVLASAVPADRHPLFLEAEAQLWAYMEGRLRHFDLPLMARGTSFQQAVWRKLLTIPYGQTRTYGELAQALGNLNKAHAVGGAANANPLPVVIPCHRLIGARGRLVGFGGGLPMKQRLLALESNLEDAEEGSFQP